MQSPAVIIFVLIVALLVGRRAGWIFSQAVLYPLPTVISAVICIGGRWLWRTSLAVSLNGSRWGLSGR